LDHVLFLLGLHGVRDIVLAVGYRSESFEESYGDGSHLGVKLTYVREEKPLDTGWAIKNVQSHLDPDETFLVFNGDILTDLDLSDMLRFHKENGSVCTISLTPVDDPSSYGVVDMDHDGRITRFTEKPRREEATSNWINAGTYLLEPQVLEYISEPRLLEEIPPGRPYSVEFGLFPTLLNEGKPLYGYRAGAYWMDIGTPAKYLQANHDLLLGRLKHQLQPQGDNFTESVWMGEGTEIDPGARLTGPIVLGKGCAIREGASLSGPLILGDGCEVREGAQLQGLVAWHNVTFDARSRSRDCLIGNGVAIGPDCQLEGMAVIGDNASLGEGNHLAHAAKIAPGIALPDKAISF
jgi:mannose-1-phosphate guanylyltransferase